MCDRMEALNLQDGIQQIRYLTKGRPKTLKKESLGDFVHEEWVHLAWRWLKNASSIFLILSRRMILDVEFGSVYTKRITHSVDRSNTTVLTTYIARCFVVVIINTLLLLIGLISPEAARLAEAGVR